VNREKEADVGDKREAREGEQAQKVIRKVVVTYRLEDDPKGEDRTFTLEHEGEGQIVDALVWGAPLMKKLGYLESDGRCTPVPTKQGKGWVLRTASAAETRKVSVLAAAAETNCVWFHAHTCIWEEYCAPVV
jgi:hypothetical protein